jgi:hypothetical protein
MKIESKWIIAPLITIGSILLALVIYVNYRNANFVFTKQLEDLGLISLLYSERFTDLVLPFWAVNSLPDGLWMLALSLAIIMIWEFKMTRQLIIWFGIGLCLGVSFELMQWFSIFPGTFDVVDLCFIIVFAFLPLLFVGRKRKGRKLSV